MNITTKFNLGDYLYTISKGTKTITSTCKTCNGSGHIQVGEDDFSCPKCYGSKVEYVVKLNKWRIYPENCGVIGKVDIERYAEKYDKDDRTVYMLDSTGVGSGTLWYEDTCFLTRDEAQVECDRHNGEVGDENL